MARSSATQKLNAPPEFQWRGLNRRGEATRGELRATSMGVAKAELRKQGVTVQRIKPKPKPLFGVPGKPIKPGDIAHMSRELSTMMESGVPLVQALDIQASGAKNPRLHHLLSAIRTDLESGLALADALAKHPKQFDDLYCNLVRAGEAAGVLEIILDTVATYKERMESLKGKIKKAMYYPAAVMTVALLVSCILLIFVIPQFNALFTGFGANLPALTQALVNLSHFMVHNWWKAAIGLAAAITAWIWAFRSFRAVRDGVDRAVLKMPIIGKIIHESSLARFARTLAITFRAGVPLVDALDTVAGATGSSVYAKAVRRVQDDVRVGQPLAQSMEQTSLFPHMVTQMTRIGENSGKLDAMLIKVAEYYEESVNNAVDSLSSLLEPIIMVVIGGMVGTMVVAMYLPIFKMAGVFRG